MFYFDEISGKKILKSDMLEAEHFFTTRESFIKTKNPEMENFVQENKKLICDYLNTTELISPHQTHTSNVELVIPDKFDYPETDGLILAQRGCAVYLNFADCTPVIIYDRVKQIGAVSHAGWRGTADKIAVKTVKKMIEEFACRPNDITALIGPAISMCCYDVGEEVCEKLLLTVSNTESLYENRSGKLYVDLKRINRQQLADCGVEDIDVCPYCTCCDNDMFFSYRKENATTDRHSAFLKLS